MPPLADREKMEANIVAELKPIFAAQCDRALSRLATHSAAGVPWAEFQESLRVTFQRELGEVFEAAGAALLIGNAFVFSTGLLHQQATAWSANFARELAAETTDNSRRALTAARQSAGDDERRLQESLAAIFLADSRIEAIAVTEVTRATSAGERGAILFFSEQHRRKLAPVWRTEEDSRVCPICRPLDGHGEIVYGVEFPGGPPGHPNCRCWLEWN